MFFLLVNFVTATHSLRKRAETYFLYDFGQEKGHNISDFSRKPASFFTESEHK